MHQIALNDTGHISADPEILKSVGRVSELRS